MNRLPGLLCLAVLLSPSFSRAETIDGRVEFAGVVPPIALQRRDTDPWCARKGLLDASFQRNADRLQNVWVRVVKGAKDEVGSPDTTVSITQRDCTYSPRVVAMQAGNTLVVRNEDPVLHNVHGYSAGTTVVNRAMPGGASNPPLSITYDMKSQQSTSDWEGVMKLKCDVHPWMSAALAVSRNPYYAVSGADGSFRIEGIPPGQYTLAAWHEKLGEKLIDITVAPGKVAHAVFLFGVRSMARTP